MATGPPVISSAAIAWLDAFAAFARMPAIFGIVTLATFVLRVVTEPLVPTPPAFEFGLLLLVLLFASGMVSGLLLTPAAIAVHRYVLLGEITGRYRLSPTNLRFQRFFLFTVVFQFLLGLRGGPSFRLFGVGVVAEAMDWPKRCRLDCSDVREVRRIRDDDRGLCRRCLAALLGVYRAAWPAARNREQSGLSGCAQPHAPDAYLSFLRVIPT